MLKFTKLGKEVNLIKEYIDQTEINFCDISQGVKYMWRDTVVIDYAIYNNFVQVINGGECITRKKQILSVMKLMESAFESSEKDGNYIYVKE